MSAILYRRNKDHVMAVAATTLPLIALVASLSSCTSIDKMISAKPDTAIDTNAYLAKISQLSTRWKVEPVPVGLSRQVFYDDALISSGEGVERKLGTVSKLNHGEAVLKQDRWWENKLGNWGVGLYFSVLTNKEGLFRCWYQYGRNDEIGYARSHDGLVWEKPILGVGLDNRVIYPAHGASVVYDDHETRWAHKYKMIYGGKGQYGTSSDGALFFAHSYNGISWTTYDDTAPLDGCGTDTGNSLLWDEEIGLYRIFVRPSKGGRSSCQYVKPYLTSGKLAIFEKLFFISRPEAPWVKLYDLMGPDWGPIYSFFCQKYGGIYIGYVNIYTPGGADYLGTKDKAGIGLTVNDKIDVNVNDFYLTFSRDGINWDFTWINKHQPLIPRGPPGSFDMNAVWPPSSPLITIGDKHLIYYCGRWPRHSASIGAVMPNGDVFKPPKPRSAIGVAEIRLDGLAYLECTGTAARVVTKSFVVLGKSLEVNADAAQGTLRCELQDAAGAPLPGYAQGDCEPIATDDCHHVVRWQDKQDLSALTGQTVRVSFTMEPTVRLYAFQVLP